MKAIKPTITAVKMNDNSIFEAEITLNLGRANKLIEGMTFYRINSLGTLHIMITDLEEKSSKARVTGISHDTEEVKPKVGLKFTSKAPKDYYGF